MAPMPVASGTRFDADAVGTRASRAGVAAPMWLAQAPDASDGKATAGGAGEAAVGRAQPDAEVMPKHDLTPWGMFMAADIVVKAVMTGLAFASVVCWTVWLAKSLELLGATRRARRSVRHLATAPSLRDGTERLRGVAGPVAAFARSAEHELRVSADAIEKDGVKERIGSRLQRIEAAAGRRMARGTGILATIGATGPFVGLFGTVWGIMTSFQSIGATGSTNLGVVAPGIAEALIATAAGLFAAIPAVYFYNHFTHEVKLMSSEMDDFALEFLTICERNFT